MVRHPGTVADVGLERRVAELERWRRAAEERSYWRSVWLRWYGYNAGFAFGIAAIVYLAASLD